MSNGVCPFPSQPQSEHSSMTCHQAARAAERAPSSRACCGNGLGGGVRSNPLRRSVHQLREAVMFMR